MTEPDHSGETPTRCGYVAIVGAPNAGKSTLVNRLVGAKVAIVTPKVQTTRARLLAIATLGASQVIFVDTPGIFVQTKRRLERAMVQAAWSGAADADLVVLLVGAKRGRDADTDLIVEGLKTAGRQAVLALNKVDIAPRAELLALAQSFDAEGIFTDTFMLSALDGSGVADLETLLAGAVPEGPWLYPEDQLADISERLLAAEITREQLFLELHQELPYALTVETEAWQDRPDGSARVEQVIYVARETHKGMVLGKGGRMVKRVGARAREELGKALGRKIHLFLFVKIRPHWQDDPERYREMGLEYPR
jgi:GTP-binding protein Era